MKIPLCRFAILCVALAVFGSYTLAQNSSNYHSLIQKGKTQLQAGNAAEALATGERSIKLDAKRWEGYALAGGALMNLKRYEEAADKLSQAILRAPEAKQAALRELRRQCLLSESGISPAAPTSAATQSVPEATTTQAEIVLWKSIENSTDPADFQSYLNQYPNGAFAILARRHVNEIQEQVEQQRKLDLEKNAPTWTDPSTGLMWTRQSTLATTWLEAARYCENLRLAGNSDWRLPAIEELGSIYEQACIGEAWCHVKGNITPSPFEAWSNSAGREPVDSIGSLI